MGPSRAAGGCGLTSAETRTRILETAARLFHEQGYNATGISTILREAGVNAGSLYHFFPGKEALLLGVLERYVHGVHPLVMAPVEAETADPIERVFALLAQYRRWYSPIEFAMGCPVGNLALELADNVEPARDLARRAFEGWWACVQGWLEAAGDRLPRDVDRRHLAQMVLTVMEGGLMQARAARSPAPYDASVEQLRRYFDLLMAQANAQREPRTST